MGMSGGKFAQLGADDVIRFLDVDHFLEELGGNLGRGRAIARTRRSFQVEDRIRLKIEAPNVDWAVPCEARIVVVRDGFLGLELMHFEQVVLPKLEDLGLEAKQNAATPPAEKTVIAPMPDLMNRGAATPAISAPPDASPARDEDDSPVSRPPLAGRRRRPRPLPADRGPVDRESASPASDEFERSSASLPPPVAPSVAEAERSSASLPPPVAPSVAEADRSSASLPPPVAPSVAEAERSSASLPPPVAPSVAEAERSSASLPPPVAPSVAEAERSSASLPPPVAPSVARSVEPPARRKPVPRAASAITSAPPASPPPMLAQEDLLVLDMSSRLTPNPLLAPAQVRDQTPADISTSVEVRPDLEAPAQVPQVDEVRPAAKTMATPMPSEYAAEDPADRSAPDSLDDLVMPSAESVPAAEPPEATALQTPGAATEDDLLELADVPDLEDDEAPDDTAEVEPEVAVPPAATEAPLEPEPEAEPEPEPEPEAEPDPEPEAKPEPPAPEPEPPIPVHNAEALEDKHPALPRVTRGGVLRVSDSATLLGLYLSQARHGRLTVLGPLPGEPGDETALKIVGSTVVSLPAEIVARVGEWVTLSIPSAEPLQEVLRDAVDSWMSELPAQPAAPVAAAVIAPAPPAAEAPVITPSAPEVIVPATPSSPPQPSSEPPAAQPAAETAEAEPEEDYGPPEVPTLVNNRVVFRRRLDLEHEIAQNLSNGGLFVEAPPLPIRTKRQLTVEVAKVSWGVELQADVVFADGGRVGFSVINAVEAVAKLQEHLAGPAPAPSTLDMPTADMRAGATESGGEAFIGSIVAPLSQRALLSLPDKQIADLSSVVRTTSLQLFEHFIAQRWKGVLKLECGAQHVEAWLHEGSVAFVIAKPYDEASSVGRILIHQKKLNEAGLREALENSKRNKKSLGRALVGLGLIKKADLSSALREQMRSKLSEALLLEAGSFEWTPWREPPGDADLVLTKGVGIIAQHLRHRFEDLNASEVEGLLGKNLARPIGHDNDLDQSTQGMHLQPKELRFLELQLDGTRSVEDAVRGSPVGRLASLRLIALGLSLGVLHFTQGGRAARQATRIGSAPDQFARVSKDLQESLHMLKSQNHFDVLGVHWSAHHRSYKDAYTKVKRQYDLKNPMLKGAPPAVMELARELLKIVDGAFEVLNDTRKRTEYRKHLFDGTERQYAADMLVKQGEVALMRGDRVGAIEALETAVELDPARRNRQLLTTAREGRR